MLKQLLSLYKISLILSVALAILLISFTVETRPLQIAVIVLGSLLGSIVLDLDYFLHAYLLEPDADFSLNLKAYVLHHDFKGALSYLNTHKDEVKEKTLNSGLFQILLIGILFLILYSTINIFIKVFLLSLYANSIYKFAENYFLHKSFEDWFWFIKGTPKKEMVGGYIILLLIFFFYFVYYF
jgi:hypothetical protein